MPIIKNIKKDTMMLVSMYLIPISMIGILCCFFLEIRSEYQKELNIYNELQSSISREYNNIRNLEIKEYEYEDSLYNLMEEYYREIQLDGNKELICRVFEECFPDEESYMENRSSAFVSMYALIEMYPEIREYNDIDNILKVINETMMQLDGTIDGYNEILDDLQDSIVDVNNTTYIRIFRGKRIPETDIKYASME